MRVRRIVTTKGLRIVVGVGRRAAKKGLVTRVEIRLGVRE
jgi:hypothetical protein